MRNSLNFFLGGGLNPPINPFEGPNKPLRFLARGFWPDFGQGFGKGLGEGKNYEYSVQYYPVEQTLNKNVKKTLKP